MSEIHVWDYLDEFVEELKLQLQEDEKRWGDTWLQRPKRGQEHRIFKRFDEYWEEWDTGEMDDMPWLKIAGEALIAWIRENHPELFIIE